MRLWGVVASYNNSVICCCYCNRNYTQTEQRPQVLYFRAFDLTHYNMIVSYCRKLCSSELLTFCKEGGTQLLQGLEFSKWTLANSKHTSHTPTHTHTHHTSHTHTPHLTHTHTAPEYEAESTMMMSPKVQILGDDSAVVAYVSFSRALDK